jgi:hypothetical protein
MTAPDEGGNNRASACVGQGLPSRRSPGGLKRDDLGTLRTKFSHCGDEIERVAPAADREHYRVAPLVEDRGLIRGARWPWEQKQFPEHGVRLYNSQTTFASITGTVTDATGAVVPNATVTATNLETPPNTRPRALVARFSST